MADRKHNDLQLIHLVVWCPPLSHSSLSKAKIKMLWCRFFTFNKHYQHICIMTLAGDWQVDEVSLGINNENIFGERGKCHDEITTLWFLFWGLVKKLPPFSSSIIARRLIEKFIDPLKQQRRISRKEKQKSLMSSSEGEESKRVWGRGLNAASEGADELKRNMHLLSPSRHSHRMPI